MYRLSIVDAKKLGGAVKFNEKINAGAGYVLLAVLALFGLLGLALFAPAWAEGLATRYREFTGDQGFIQTLISAPILAFEFVVFEVTYLLWLVHRDRMFSTTVFKWVRLLSISSFAMAAAFVAIGAWLATKNTLPPAIGFVLAGLTLTSLAIASVTKSLLTLLEKATITKRDLEGVI